MKRFVFVMLVFLLVFSFPVLALDKLTGFVNDEANVISPEFRQMLNDDLYNLKLNTSVEMAIATVNTTGDVPIEEYSLNLADKTLGVKGKDNGVLILLAVNDRDYRIEVGYGLEPVLNAALLGRIGRSVMAPNFSQGNYEQGLLDGERVISAILMNDTSFETQGGGDNLQSLQPLIVPGIVMLIFAAIMIFSFISAYKNAKKKLDEKNKKDGKKDDKHDHEFLSALILANMFGRGGSGGSGGFGGGSGGFGGFGGGSFGGGGFSGHF